MKNFKLWCISLCLLLLVAGCGQQQAPGNKDAEDKGEQTGAILGAFTAENLERQSVDESLWEGKKLTMVNVWATFCGPCLKEMPDLGALHQEYAQEDFQVVGIVIDVLDEKGQMDESQLEKARKVVEETGANYPHLLPSQDLITAKLSQVSAVPETFFVDEQGNQVGESYLGSMSKKEWAKIIEEKLEEVSK